jgi:hypothetical protein
MPQGEVSAIDPNLQEGQNKAVFKQEQVQEVIDLLTGIEDVMRKKDNVAKTAKLRIDSAAQISNDNKAGGRAGDWKVDIQNNAKKGQSYTIAVVYVAPDATSLADLKKALINSWGTQKRYRVT